MSGPSQSVAPEDRPANVNALWGRDLAAALVGAGVTRVVVSPGSRSTPIVCGVVATPELEAFPVLDERTAGFVALGLARSRREPVALVCTSGSALAHYLPAIIEAAEARIPLVVLSADRPPELRHCASGQTIDQLKIFGDFVRFFAEAALPGTDVHLRRHLQALTHLAIDRSRGPDPGPVHLNLPFRDPLAPHIADGTGAADCEPLSLRPAAETQVAYPEIPYGVPDGFGLVIAGMDHLSTWDDLVVDALRTICQRRDVIILADALSPLRHRAPSLPVLAHYDLWLFGSSWADALRPDWIWQFGHLPTSKGLRSWLAGQPSLPRTLVTAAAERPDPTHLTTERVPLPADRFVQSIAPSVEAGSSATERSRVWLEADQQVNARLLSPDFQDSLRPESRLVRTLAEKLPEGGQVCVASSLPVRETEAFWPTTNRGYRVLANRGANGIDGTLGTAVGTALASDAPTFLLTGDLAFLHDSNGLLAWKELEAKLTVFLIDNQGGAIFEYLPIAQTDRTRFERFFATPQPIDFAALCAAHGIGYQFLDSVDDLPEMDLENPPPGVVHLRVDRENLPGDRKALREKLVADLPQPPTL